MTYCGDEDARPLSRKQGKLIVLVGPSGSGKSTAWHPGHDQSPMSPEAEANWPYVYVSSDDLRESMFGDRTYQLGNHEVFLVFHELLVSNLKAGRTVVADATHVTPGSRFASLSAALKGNAGLVEYHVYYRKDSVPWHGNKEVVIRQTKLFADQINHIRCGDAYHRKHTGFKIPVIVYDHRSYKVEQET